MIKLDLIFMVWSRKFHLFIYFLMWTGRSPYPTQANRKLAKNLPCTEYIEAVGSWTEFFRKILFWYVHWFSGSWTQSIAAHTSMEIWQVFFVIETSVFGILVCDTDPLRFNYIFSIQSPGLIFITLLLVFLCIVKWACLSHRQMLSMNRLITS